MADGKQIPRQNPTYFVFSIFFFSYHLTTAIFSGIVHVCAPNSISVAITIVCVCVCVVFGCCWQIYVIRFCSDRIQNERTDVNVTRTKTEIVALVETFTSGTRCTTDFTLVATHHVTAYWTASAPCSILEDTREYKMNSVPCAKKGIAQFLVRFGVGTATLFLLKTSAQRTSSSFAFVMHVLPSTNFECISSVFESHSMGFLALS